MRNHAKLESLSIDNETYSEKNWIRTEWLDRTTILKFLDQELSFESIKADGSTFIIYVSESVSDLFKLYNYMRPF